MKAPGFAGGSLLLFQVDGPNPAKTAEGMDEQVEFLVPVPEIAVHAYEVEPGGFGQSEDGADAESAKEGQEARVVVDVVMVVHDHKGGAEGS